MHINEMQLFYIPCTSMNKENDLVWYIFQLVCRVTCRQPLYVVDYISEHACVVYLWSCIVHE